jgi:hypothetical protein
MAMKKVADIGTAHVGLRKIIAILILSALATPRVTNLNGLSAVSLTK